MSLRKMEDTMIWTAQSLMGTYHSLRAEQESAAANAELMQGKYEKAVRQAALGTISQADADEAGKAAREAEWKAASRRMELGMLSRQEYMEARAAYLDGVAAKAQADVDFQQAMDTYDWAVKGLTGI